MNLYICTFLPNNKERENEIREAIDINCNLPFIKNIYLFQESKDITISHKKILNVYLDSRPTYQNIIDYSNEMNNEINIICNSDISLTYTFQNLKICENDFFCLTRYENNKLFRMANCSQDTWCWKNKCKITNANFYFGILGCDNTIAWLAKQKGYNVTNPCKKYITNHHHFSNFRTYNEETRLPRNKYLVGLYPS